MTQLATESSFSSLGLMGGCGSSGTTLLVHLLSRHPGIGSGPEFNCFNHPELYDIQRLHRIYPAMKAGRAPPAGYVDVPVFMTHRPHFAVDDDLIESWMRESGSSQEFVGRLLDHLLRLFSCSVVLEKSPSNVYCFVDAARELEGVKLIHLIRDGRDVVVSLMRRGFNLFGAGSRWLYDTVRGLEARGARGYLEARYEGLVRDPDGTTARILEHLDVPDPEMPERQSSRRGLYTEEWRSRSEPRAWNQTPSDPISDRSVGQYRERLSHGDLDQLYRIRLLESVPSAPGIPREFGELLDFLGYTTNAEVPDGPPTRRHDLRLEMQDYRRRVERFWGRNYWHLPHRLTRIGGSRG